MYILYVYIINLSNNVAGVSEVYSDKCFVLRLDHLRSLIIHKSRQLNLSIDNL